MRSRWWEMLSYIAYATCIAIVIGAWVGGLREAKLQATCLNKGYPEIRFGGLTGRVAGKPYCVKRLDQTDTVVALDELR